MMEELALFIVQSTESGMWKQFYSSFAAKGTCVLPVVSITGQEMVAFISKYGDPKEGALMERIVRYRNRLLGKKLETLGLKFF